MWIQAHSAVAGWRQIAEQRRQLSAPIKEWLGLQSTHPVIKNPKLLGILLYIWQRYLVSPPGALEIMAFDFAWGRPAFRRTQHNHGPARPAQQTLFAGGLLVFADFNNAMLSRRGHGLMHGVDVGALDKVRCPTITAQKALEFLVRDSRQQRRVVDLVAVEVKNRQNCAVTHRIQKLVDVPRGGERPGLRFAIAHHRGYD